MKVAEGTLSRSAEVLQTITPISKNVEDWANNLSNNEYSTTAYEQAIFSAEQAGITVARRFRAILTDHTVPLKVLEQ